jgi:mono/diheme cytochrome c family protein
MCHTEGFSEFPHSGRRAGAPDCAACHGGSSPFDFDGIVKGVKESVHATRVDPAFRCTNCHSPHYFIPATRLTDLAFGIESANQGCLGCHASGPSPSGARSALESLAKRHAALLPHPRLHLQANPCIACHTDLRGREITAPLQGPGPIHKVLPASAALKDCAACHGRNSVLATKLYAHLAVKERAEQGWLNSVLFNTAYVTGATRNRWLDWGTFGLTALTVLGIGVHGVGRWLGARLRRRS